MTKINVSMDAEELARMYKEIQGRIKKLEEELQPYKSGLEMAALEAGGILNLSSFKVSLIEGSRENFSVADAKLVLGEEALKPFIKTICYTQLRVTQKSG